MLCVRVHEFTYLCLLLHKKVPANSTPHSCVALLSPSCPNSQKTRAFTRMRLRRKCNSSIAAALFSLSFSLQKPKPQDEFHVHIQAAVLSAMSHHVLCDYVNESMGMFGGTVDEQQRTIYIEHFYACHRFAPVYKHSHSSNRTLKFKRLQRHESAAPRCRGGRRYAGA